MDDLSGIGWSQTRNQQKSPPARSFASMSTLQPTPPMSGRSSPFPAQTNPSKSPLSKPMTSSNDSFASLLNFQSTNPTKNLSLAERQKQLVEQRAREEQEKQEQLKTQYGAVDERIWDSLEMPAARGHASGTPLSQVGGASGGGSGGVDEDDDLLAAFNASAPVDKSTNFPIPSASPSIQDDQKLRSPAMSSDLMMEDDDDPFGMAEFHASRHQRLQDASTESRELENDDDVLGLLAKPVSEFQKRESATPCLEVPGEPEALPARHTPEDRAIAELVDMGFPIEKAREALAQTSSGTDVQQAVSWLLNQAHSQAKEKAQSKNRTGNQELSPDPDTLRPRGRENGKKSSPSHDRSSNDGGPRDKDPGQLASEFGSTLFKSANSLWKTGSKRVQQAVQEFNTGASDASSQPRWMRENTRDPSRSRDRKVDTQLGLGPPERLSSSQAEFITNEAMMLEIVRDQPAPVSHPRGREPRETPHPPSTTRGRLPDLPTRPRFSSEDDLRKQARPPLHQHDTKSQRSQLSRFGADEQAAQAYVSPARRRKATSSVPPSVHEPDLLESPSLSPRPTRPATTSPARQTRSPTPARPKAPPRSIPKISSISLENIHNHRQKGTEAFKRGDYAVANTCYSNAISSIPDGHPILIILLTNRALTALKTGEPKNAIGDADRAISVIGVSKGDSEVIDLGNGEPTKDMREFYGKALMRKAEALEQLERWKEALSAWREAIESGHGGGTSIQGRNRCEKAASIAQNGVSSAPKSVSTPVRPKPASRPSVPKVVSARPAEAVNRLRAANEEADRVDNEKFNLADSVDAKLTAWKGGKQDNLRALLASLDTVLWPEAGWKKISMAELILPNKVKIQYMKGIAKVHPDKIPVNATTEQKMISGAVFSTLNEAWDKFKRENNL